MIYRIHVSKGEDSYTVVRRRADAAEVQLMDIVRAEIAGHGGLDTAWGKAAWNSADSLDIRRGGQFMIHPELGPVIYVTTSKIG